MGGATQGDNVDIKSCIAFMNTVDKSKNMAADLQTDNVKKWVAGWLNENANGRPIANYSLEHLDASSNAAARETAKLRLASADAENPHGIVNVGIFGEGTDSPSLSAVAFLEQRKSPIDVIQAVGRAMRTAPGKELGYIVCPILFERTADPEKWLSNSGPEEGWQELGQILPRPARPRPAHRGQSRRPSVSVHPQAAAGGEVHPGGRHRRGQAHTVRRIRGSPGEAEEAVEQMLEGKSRVEVGVTRIAETSQAPYRASEPTQILTGKKNDDGSTETPRRLRSP